MFLLLTDCIGGTEVTQTDQNSKPGCVKWPYISKSFLKAFEMNGLINVRQTLKLD